MKRSEYDAFGRQTWTAKPGEVHKRWQIVDAEGISLGRLAAEIAPVLMGKHRPEYTPHVDTGDHVIVINAGKVGLTGRKAEQKHRKTYSRYPGGLKLEPWGNVRDRRPQLLVEDAVKRMLPKNRLGRVMLKKLHVYPGTEHPHEGMQPVELKA